VLDLWRRGERVPDELLDPEIEWVNPDRAVESGTRRGREGWARAQRNYTDSFELLDVEIERIAERGDRVITLLRMTSEGKGSGVSTTLRMSGIWTVRERRLARFEWHTGPEAALAALDEAH